MGPYGQCDRTPCTGVDSSPHCFHCSAWPLLVRSVTRCQHRFSLCHVRVDSTRFTHNVLLCHLGPLLADQARQNEAK